MPSRPSTHPPRRSRRVYHDAVTKPDPGFAAHLADPSMPAFLALDDEPSVTVPDPAALVLTCANCGALMDERKCKLICRCGYFASCSDYY
jgi:hypothetical protein